MVSSVDATQGMSGNESNQIPRSGSSNNFGRSESRSSGSRTRSSSKSDSPPPQVPSDKPRKKEKSTNPDVLSIDLMMPSTDLHSVTFFGETSSRSGESGELGTSGTRPLAFSKGKLVARARASPDREKSLPPIAHLHASGEYESSGEPDAENEQYNEAAAESRIQTSRGPKSYLKDKKGVPKKTGPVTVSEVQLFNRTASNIAENINNLKLGLQDIEKAIKTDNDTITKYAVSLQQLEIKRESLASKIREKEEWLQKYSNNVLPLQEQIVGLYERVGQVRASLSPQRNRLTNTQ